MQAMRFAMRGSILLPVIVISMMVSMLLMASTQIVTNDLDRVLLFRQRLVACEQADRAHTLLDNHSITLPFTRDWLGVQVKGYRTNNAIHIQANDHGVVVSFVQHTGEWIETE